MITSAFPTDTWHYSNQQIVSAFRPLGSPLSFRRNHEGCWARMVLEPSGAEIERLVFTGGTLGRLLFRCFLLGSISRQAQRPQAF